MANVVELLEKIFNLKANVDLLLKEVEKLGFNIGQHHERIVKLEERENLLAMQLRAEAAQQVNIAIGSLLAALRSGSLSQYPSGADRDPEGASKSPG